MLAQRPPISSRNLMRLRMPSQVKPSSIHSHVMPHRYCGSLLCSASGWRPRVPLSEANSSTAMSSAVCHQGASSGLRQPEQVGFRAGFVRPWPRPTHLIMFDRRAILSEVGYSNHGRCSHRVGGAYADRKISRLAVRLQRAAIGRHRGARSGEARRHRSQHGGRVHHGQRGLRRAGPESGAAGSARRRAFGPRQRHDHQQSLRLGTEGGRARPAGDPDGEFRDRGCRRHGEHDQCSVPSAKRAQGISPGRSEGRGLDGARRPLGRLQRLSHGQHRRERCREVSHHPRRAG